MRKHQMNFRVESQLTKLQAIIDGEGKHIMYYSEEHYTQWVLFRAKIG
jgi:hypothetical protein